MDLEQMRARIKAISDLLAGFQASASLTDEDLAQVEKLSEEFDTLTKQIDAKEKMAAIAARSSQSTRKVAPATATTAEVNAGANRVEKDPMRGFASMGEFYSLVIDAKKSGSPDKKLVNAGLMEKYGEDGGFLVPEDFRMDIQKKITGDESLLSRTTQFTTSSNNLLLPVNETAPWDASAGIQATWEGEGQTGDYTQDKFREFGLRLHKLSAKVKVTEELMEDAPLLETWIKNQAPGAIVQKINSAIIKGTGAGQPQGILNSPFRKVVAKESAQSADTVVWENINKMLGALTPASLSRAVWIVNPGILPLLRLMTFGTGGSNPVPVYLPATGVSGAPFGTLFGLPILPMMGGVKAVGDEGDIMLVDLAYYFSVVKSGGVKTTMSTHVFFDQDAVALKFTQRIAGGVPYLSPITNEAGDFQASGIVTLADRA